MEPLHAPWRIEYILAPKSESAESLFARIAQSTDDEANYIIARDRSCYALLNAYPYTGGHLMIVPYKQTPDLNGLTDEELADLLRLTRRCQDASTKVMKPDGFNIGINLGKVAGAGICGHLHIHVVPRWQGDTNFMPILANTVVVPEALRELAAKLRAALARDSATQLDASPKPFTSKAPASRSSFITTTRATSRPSRINWASRPPRARAGSSSKARPMPWSAPSTCSCCWRIPLQAGTPVRSREFSHALSIVKHEGVSALKDIMSDRIQTSDKKPGVTAKTVGQKKYLDAIRRHDVTIGVGPAGTGKTYLAVAMALAALRDRPGLAHYPDPPRRRGRRGARLPAGRPLREDPALFAPAARRAARHAARRGNPEAHGARRH